MRLKNSLAVGILLAAPLAGAGAPARQTSAAISLSTLTNVYRFSGLQIGRRRCDLLGHSAELKRCDAALLTSLLSSAIQSLGCGALRTSDA